MGQQAATGPGLGEQKRAITAHLEFLGYEVTSESNRLVATHSQHSNFQIEELNGGTIFLSYWKTSPYAKAHPAELLATLNRNNSAATTTTFFVDKDGDLGLSAWYTGGYEKKRFAEFIERWNRDWIDALQRNDFELGGFLGQGDENVANTSTAPPGSI